MTERGAGGLSVIAWLASPVLLVVMGWLAGLRLNLTSSLPVGLYVQGQFLSYLSDQLVDRNGADVDADIRLRALGGAVGIAGTLAKVVTQG